MANELPFYILLLAFCMSMWLGYRTQRDADLYMANWIDALQDHKKTLDSMGHMAEFHREAMALAEGVCGPLAGMLIWEKVSPEARAHMTRIVGEFAPVGDIDTLTTVWKGETN